MSHRDLTPKETGKPHLKTSQFERAAKPETTSGEFEQEVTFVLLSLYRSPMFQTWPCKDIVPEKNIK